MHSCFHLNFALFLVPAPKTSLKVLATVFAWISALAFVVYTEILTKLVVIELDRRYPSGRVGADSYRA